MTDESLTSMQLSEHDKDRLDVIRAVDYAGASSVTYRELLNEALDAWEEDRDVDTEEFLESAVNGD